MIRKSIRFNTLENKDIYINFFLKESLSKTRKITIYIRDLVILVFKAEIKYYERMNIFYKLLFNKIFFFFNAYLEIKNYPVCSLCLKHDRRIKAFEKKKKKKKKTP